jgi:hypothetical protein
MNIYGKAAKDRKRKANSKLVAMALNNTQVAESVMGSSGSFNELSEAV